METGRLERQARGTRNALVRPQAPGRHWERRVDGLVLLLLALVTIVLRWRDRERYFWAWDSVLFALGIEHYDINAAQPHPPGFPVFVFIAKTVQLLVGDTHSALLVTGILASAAGVCLLYAFLRRIRSRRAAFAGATLLAVSPLFHFQGTLTLSYVTEVPLSVGLAWAAWNARGDPRPGTLATLGLVWSLGVGLRQSLFFTLTPLVFYALAPSLNGWKVSLHRAAWTLLAAFLCGLAWFVPMVAFTGVQRWAQLTSQQSQLVFGRTVFNSGVDALQEHSTRVASYLHHEFMILGAVVLLVLVSRAVVRAPKVLEKSPTPRGPGIGFFFAWLLPGLIFNLLFYSGYWPEHNGYVLVILPGMYAAGALATDGGLRRLEGAVRWPTLARLARVIAVPLLLAPLPGLVLAAHDDVERLVRVRDADVERWLPIGTETSPADTAILTESYFSWLLVKWYLPKHTTWLYLGGHDANNTSRFAVVETRDRHDDTPFYEASERFPNLPSHEVPASIRRVLLRDGGLPAILRPGVGLEEGQLGNGDSFTFFRTTPDRSMIEDYLQARA